MHEFSIIITTYNRARLLPRAVESVRAQTHSDWELIIVDDGSTDDTETVVDKWRGDERIRYVKMSENQGASAARNRGIKEARGAFVMVWDSDDELYPNALAMLAEARRAHPDAGIISALAVPMKVEKEVAYEKRPEGFVALPQVLCKYLGNYEKVRAARRELYETAHYRARNLDFMVNGYLAAQAPWYHLAEPLGILHIDGNDSLTRARTKKNPAHSIARAPYLAAYLEEFGSELKKNCPRRYADYAYGATLGFLLRGDTISARRWSRETSIALFLLVRIPRAALLVRYFYH